MHSPIGLYLSTQYTVFVIYLRAIGLRDLDNFSPSARLWVPWLDQAVLASKFEVGKANLLQEYNLSFDSFKYQRRKYMNLKKQRRSLWGGS